MATKDNKLVKDVRRAFSREEGSSLVPAMFLAFGILDAIPIPSDIGYFYVQKWLKENENKLPADQYWMYSYLNYYGWDVAWYITLFLVTLYGGKTVTQQLQLGGAIVATGAIITMLWKFAHPNIERKPAKV